jgi:hypothetical protein
MIGVQKMAADPDAVTATGSTPPLPKHTDGIKMFINFLVGNADLVLIVFNVWTLGATLGAESSYVPWRDVLDKPSDSAAFASFKANYQYIKNISGYDSQYDPEYWTGNWMEYEDAGHEFMPIVPETLISSEATCMDGTKVDDWNNNVVAPSVWPLAALVFVMLAYKFYATKLWLHQYGSWGHVSALVNVRNYVVYRMLLILLFITTFAIIFGVYVPDGDFGNVDYVFALVLSVLNILTSFNELRAHNDATLEFPEGKGEKIHIGSFKWSSKAEVVNEAVEDGIMVLLTTGHDDILVNDCLMTPENSQLLKDCVMNSGVIQRHSISAFIKSAGKTTVPKDLAVDDAGNLEVSKDSKKKESSPSPSASSEDRGFLSKVASIFAFFFANLTFVVAIFNIFVICWTFQTEANTKNLHFPISLYQLGQGWPDRDLTECPYVDASGVTQKVNFDPFVITCRYTGWVERDFFPEAFGGFPGDENIAFIIFCVIGGSLAIGIGIIAYIAEVHRHPFGTFGFVQGISDAPKNVQYRRLIYGIMSVVVLSCFYAIYGSGETCLPWADPDEDFCGPVELDQALAIVVAGANAINLLKGTLSASKVRLAHSPAAELLPIPNMTIFDSPSVWYEMLQDGLLMYIAKDNSDILCGNLGMSMEDVDTLVNALCDMEVHKDQYSTKTIVSHPATVRRGKSKDQFGSTRGVSFRKVEKKDSSIAIAKMTKKKSERTIAGKNAVGDNQL